MHRFTRREKCRRKTNEEKLRFSLYLSLSLFRPRKTAALSNDCEVSRHSSKSECSLCHSLIEWLAIQRSELTKNDSLPFSAFTSREMKEKEEEEEATTTRCTIASHCQGQSECIVAREAIEQEGRRMMDAECRDMSNPVNTTGKMTCLIDY